MSPRMKRERKSGSVGSKNPKLYGVPSPVAGSATRIALWPKRSQKISPGSIVTTPMRGRSCASCARGPREFVCVGAAAAAIVQSDSPSTTSSRARRPGLHVTQHTDMERVHAARIGAGDAEYVAAERQLLAGFGQVPDRGRD